MTRIVPAIALALLSAGWSDGACPQVRQQVRAEQPQLIFAAPIALPSYYPAFGAGGDNDQDLKDIKELLKAILAELKAGGGGNEPVPAGGLTMATIAAQACQGCHQEGKAPKGGLGGFAIVDKDGKLAELDKGDRRAIYARIRLDLNDKLHMPPARRLSPAALKVIEEWAAGK